MNRVLTRHLLFLSVIGVLNFIMVSDYLYHGTKAANLDAIAHITTIAQFHTALRDGEFPVQWGDGFANYGLPLGTIAHQLPAYAGALLTFVTHDPLLSFNIVYLICALLSAILLYLFVSRYLSAESSLLATIVYSLAPYRIMNLYIRGAMPEFASAIWVLVILLAVWGIDRFKTVRWYLLLSLGCLGLILTHPMMLIVYAPVIGVWMVIHFRLRLREWAKVVMCGVLGLMLSAYYFLPLNLEVKYLYYGTSTSNYARNQTTTLDTFFNPFWQYSCAYRNDIFGRCHLTKGGVMETGIMIALLALTLSAWLYRRIPSRWVHTIGEGWRHFVRERGLVRLVMFTFLGALISVACSTSLFEPLYERIKPLGSIQYPWRYLSAYLFFPPIALGILFERIHKRRFADLVFYALVLWVVFSRFPQLYGKNYTYVPVENYYFTIFNLHSVTMNTIWSGDAPEYPVKRDKAEIVQGTGQIVSRTLWNARRLYTIHATSQVTVSDNTFYFPGWKVYVDGAESPIQFQDPAYRGIITFHVPPGRHEVEVVYTDTKVRLVGKLLSAGTLVCLTVLCAVLLIRRISRHGRVLVTLV